MDWGIVSFNQSKLIVCFIDYLVDVWFPGEVVRYVYEGVLLLVLFRCVFCVSYLWVISIWHLALCRDPSFG